MDKSRIGAEWDEPGLDPLRSGPIPIWDGGVSRLVSAAPGESFIPFLSPRLPGSPGYPEYPGSLGCWGLATCPRLWWGVRGGSNWADAASGGGTNW